METMYIKYRYTSYWYVLSVIGFLKIEFAILLFLN